MQVIEPLLIGNYKIIQDTEKYRFTSDSVHLARFVKAKRGERVADFCSGSGVVGLHFFAENTGVSHVTLIEMQKDLAAMSRETVALNGLESVFTVENCRVQDIPKEYTEVFRSSSVIRRMSARAQGLIRTTRARRAATRNSFSRSASSWTV